MFPEAFLKLFFKSWRWVLKGFKKGFKLDYEDLQKKLFINISKASLKGVTKKFQNFLKNVSENVWKVFLKCFKKFI